MSVIYDSDVCITTYERWHSGAQRGLVANDSDRSSSRRTPDVPHSIAPHAASFSHAAQLAPCNDPPGGAAGAHVDTRHDGGPGHRMLWQHQLFIYDVHKVNLLHEIYQHVYLDKLSY